MTGTNDDADYRVMLDAIPSPILVVDKDMGIRKFNKAAGVFMGQNPKALLLNRFGHACHCLRSQETPGGCGQGPLCQDCVVRNSVAACLAEQNVARKSARMWLAKDGQEVEVSLLVTTSAFHLGPTLLVLLILEDVSELVEVRRLLPMCAGCKKIRDEKEYWHHVESYLNRRWDIDFTLGLCPECASKKFPKTVGPGAPP